MTNNSILLLDSHNGIYIPKLFAEDIISGNYQSPNKKECLKELSELGNPENEGYWDAWEVLLSKIKLIGSNNTEYYLFQYEGDVWAIPSDEQIPNDLY